MALLPTAVAVGLVLLLWAATQGPASLIGASGRRLRHDFSVPSASSSSQTANTDDPLARLRNRPPVHDLSWIGDLISWALLLALLGLVLVAAGWLWRHRPRITAPTAVEFDALPEVGAVAESVDRDAANQAEALDQGDPRNGIVRCWLLLEQSVAAAGVLRDPAETSTEFTVRVLRALDIDPRPIGALAALFREARFSEHRLTEESRTAARSALQRIHADLRDLSALDAGGTR